MADKNIYDEILDQNSADQAQGLRESVFAASQTSPDVAAKTQKVATETGLPSDLVVRNPDQAGKVNTVDGVDYDYLIEHKPATSQWLANPDNASVAHDDIANLGQHERHVQEYNALESLGKSFVSGSAQMGASIARVPAFIVDVKLRDYNFLLKILGQGDKQIRSPDWMLNNPAAKYFDAQQEAWKTPEMDQSIIEQARAGDFAGAGKSLFSQVVANAPNQAVILAASLFGTPMAGLAFAGITQGAQANKTSQESGVDPLAATTDAILQGTLEAALENVGTMGVLRKWEGVIAKSVGKQTSKKVVAEFGKTLAYSFLAEGNEEFWTQVGQDLSDYITGVNPDALKGIIQRATDAGLIGGFSGVSMTSPSALLAGRSRMRQVQQAQRARDFYLSLGKTAEASKLRERLPAAHQNYIESITKNTPVENIYVPIDAYEMHMQSKNVDPAAVSSELGIAQEYDQAKETGKDIKIPLATWANKVVGTEHYSALANDVKFDPEGKTLNEIKAEDDQTKKEMEKASSEAIKADVQKEADAQAAQVSSLIGEQLKATGRFSPKDIKHLSGVWGSFMRAFGERAGVGPMQMFQSNPVNVNTADSVVVPQGQTEMNQAGEAGLYERALRYDDQNEFIKDYLKSNRFDMPMTEEPNIQGYVGDLKVFLQEPNKNPNFYMGKETLTSTSGNIEKYKGENGAFRYLYREAGKIVGAVQGVSRGKKENVLSNIVVDEANQKSGIATKLVDEVRNDFKGVKLSHLFTNQGAKFFGVKSKDELSSIWKDARGKNLVAAHNLTAENLIHADRMGGLAVPSLSIGKSEHPLENFGEITLLASKDFIDPKKKTNKVFNADIYSPRYPSVKYELDSKKFKAAQELVKKESVDLGRNLGSEIDSGNFQFKGMQALYQSAVIRLHYLRQIGQDIIIPKKAPKNEYIGLNPELEKYIDKYSIPSDLYNNKAFLKEYENLRKAVMNREEQASLLAGSTPEEAKQDGKTYGSGWYPEKKPNYNIIRSIQEEIRAKEEAGLPDFYAADNLISDAISPIEEKFSAWVDKTFSGIIGKEKLYNGEDRSYNARYLPHTLENVVRVMKRELQSGEGFTYGLGNVRAATAKRYSSIRQIQEDRSKILSKNQFDKAKQFTDKEFDSIVEEAYKVYEHKERTGIGDTFVNLLIDGIRRGNVEAELKEYGFSGMNFDRIRAFLSVLKNMPTEYFEAKIQRAVTLNEFSGAVIPKGAQPEVVDILKKNDLPFVEYDPQKEGDRIRAVNELSTRQDILFQGVDPLGAILFGKQGAMNILLLKDMNYSTFLHETGHAFLEILRRYSSAQDATPEITDMSEKTLKWLGVESWDQLEKKHHEQFAKGFEQYLFEGKAPSEGLRQAFARFRIWLISVYKSLTGLGVPLSDEIRRVMDRMLATDEEIDQAQAEQGAPLIADPVSILGEERGKRYLDAVQEARQEAQESLQLKLMEEYQQERKSWWLDELARVKEQVTKEVNARPEQIAMSILRDGTMPDGSELPINMQNLKINRYDVIRFIAQENNVSPTEKDVRDLIQKFPRGTMSRDGISLSIVGELFGFSSPAKFVDSLMNTPEKQELIDRISEERMKEMHGEIFGDKEAMQEQAQQAIHNDKQELLLRMELEYLASAKTPVLKDLIRTLSARIPSDQAAKRYADEIIGKTTLEQLRPAQYRSAERRMAKAAGVALAQGKFDEAFEAKRKELLNHELYRASVAAREDFAKSVDGFKKILRSDEKLAKSRDMDFVNAARSILAMYGIGAGAENPHQFLKNTQLYDPDTFEVMTALIDSAMEGVDKNTSLPNISYNQFSNMRDAVNAIYDIARRSRQIQLADQRYEIEAVVAGLNDRLQEVSKKGKTAEYTKSADGWEKAGRALLGALAQGRRVESWVDYMDGGNSQGWFTRAIWNPVIDGTQQFRLKNREYTLKFLQLIKPIEKTLVRREIVSPELKHIFSSKSELLGALLHSGNESNLSKLLRGRGWGMMMADGTLDRSRWDAFVSRMQNEGVLTKEDYDFLQSCWDLFEELKPAAQRAHKEMYGHYFNTITANEFVTPWGKYRGGYVPAMADPFLSEDAAIRREKEEAEKINNSYMFPTAGRGFTKSRVESYAAPLIMDLRLVPQAINKELRFIHIEPHIKDVARVVRNSEFRSALAAFDPEVGKSMLAPWLQRAAQQVIELPDKTWTGWSVWRWIRTRSGINIMAGNVVNTLQQFTGISIGAVKVKPSYLRNALWTYFRNPRVMAEAISESSDFMKTRTTTHVIEIQNTINDIILDQGKYTKALKFAERHAYFLQQGTQNFVDMIVWSGGYDQSVAQGNNHDQAVRDADSAVRLTQGDFSPENVSNIESGNAFARAFMMFYSYFNMQANLMGTEFSKVSRDMGLKRGAGRALYVYLLGFMIPAVISQVILDALSGQPWDKDDDGYLDDFLATFFGSQFRTGMAMLPFVGQVANVVVNKFDNKWYNDDIRVSPAISMIESAAGVPLDVYKAIKGDEVNRKTAIRDSLSLLGLLTGIPVSPLSKPIGYLSDVEEGNVYPENKIDFARGLLTGKGKQ